MTYPPILKVETLFLSKTQKFILQQQVQHIERREVKMKDIIHSIKKQLVSFSEEVKTYPCYSEIKKHMTEAKKQIDHPFQNDIILMLAFCRVKLEIEGAGENNATYKNDSLAQIGDAVLDLIIVERGFGKGKTKREIDHERQLQATNKQLHSITESKGLSQFCYHENYFYNDAPQHDRVSAGTHDAIVEAIIGAIYLDGGLDKAREWILKNVLSSQ